MERQMQEYQVRSPQSRFFTAWLVTAVSDALFSSFLSSVPYESTVARLWQGVASVVLGPDAMNGGMRTVLIGLAMHFTVALTWTAIFMFVLFRDHRVIKLVNKRFGVVAMACLYGPVIWMVMSFVVIPAFTHKPPAITYKWWIQFFGHIPFVAFPIVALVSRGSPTLRGKDPDLASWFGANRKPDGSHIDPDGQIQALLTNKAYQYVAARLNRESLPTGAYEYVFTVRRNDIEEYIAREGFKPEDFGAAHWLSLHHVGEKWIVRQFIPPEKSPGYDDDTPFDTYEAAQSALLTKLLGNAQTGIQF